MKERFRGLSRYVLLFVLGVALIAVYKTFDNFDSILNFAGRVISVIQPFIIGLFIAFLLYKPACFFEKRLMKAKNRFISSHARSFSVAAVYLIAVILLALLVTFALPAIFDGVVNFVTAVPDYYKQLMSWLNPLVSDLGLPEELAITSMIEALYKDYLQPRLTAENIQNSIIGIAGVASSVIGLLMALISSIYMLISRESLLRNMHVLLGLVMPGKWLGKLTHYVKKSAVILYTYFYSQVLDALVVAVLMTVGLLLFGVPNALILGVMIGIMNMIPYFGAIVSCAVVVVMVLLSGELWKAAGVAVYILVMQQIDANVLQPRIIGTTVGIRPIYVLFAITLGGGLFGFWGIFIGIPCVAIVQMLLRDYIGYRESAKKRGQDGNRAIP